MSPPGRSTSRCCPTPRSARCSGAAIEATEEAILNALIGAETLTGIDGVTAHALPHDALVDVMVRYGRGPEPRR
jgi:D-aminopeptidase